MKNVLVFIKLYLLVSISCGVEFLFFERLNCKITLKYLHFTILCLIFAS